MFTDVQLSNAFNESLSVINFQGGFDTFTFRKGFEGGLGLSPEEKNEILDYLKTKVRKGDHVYQKVKAQIDKEEFLSADYYENPVKRQFRGSYFPVVLKTLAGIMAPALQ
jgi:hypothetical protein